MTIPLSDRVARGVVVLLSDRERALFPVGTVITRDSIGVLTATVPTSKADAPVRHVVYIGWLALGIVVLPTLAAVVRMHFPQPPPESVP